MAVVMWVVVGATVFFAYIAVHELGHAGAARLIGVPADRVAVRLFEWSAHVALEAGGDWHRPGTAAYDDAYAEHDPRLRWLGVFIASGFIVQTTVMVAAVIVIGWTGPHGVDERLVRISIAVNGVYLLGDATATAVARAPVGDMSSLLRFAPVVGVATLVGLVAGHAAAWSIA